MDPILPTIAKSVSPFSGALKNIFKGVKDEFIDWFQIGISEYIEESKKKFASTNTFISRSEKVNFYDVYFPLNLKSKNKKINSDNILEKLFEKNNCSAILGMAGSGKTMLMKHTFLQTYDQLYAIPIFIELRDLNTLGISLLDYIYLIILKNKIKPSTRIVERALENGGFVFFFDGFDEISLELKEKLVLEIEHLVDTFSKNKFILSSRPGANAESLPRFHTFIVEPLTYDQIVNFIKKQLFNANDKELIEKLNSTIALGNTDYAEYLTNPLLLSMYILTYRNYPELPKSKNKFYWNVFDTLCTKHDSINKKGAYTHQKKSKLQNEHFETILRWLSYISVPEYRFNFDEQYLSEKLQYIKKALKFDFEVKDLIYDLTVSISILVVEGLNYKFPHRTMQDYFMILFVKDQSDESKEFIYKEKFKRVHPVNLNSNIFDLCIELDKEAYYKYYVLPLFEKFITIYNNIDLTESAITYLKELQPDLIISFDDHEESMSIGSCYIIDHIDIATFYKIKTLSIFTIKYTGKRNENLLISTILKETPKTKDLGRNGIFTNVYKIEALPRDILKALVIEYLNLKEFATFLENMHNKYLFLQDEFKKDLLTNNSLIGFIPSSKDND